MMNKRTILMVLVCILLTGCSLPTYWQEESSQESESMTQGTTEVTEPESGTIEAFPETESDTEPETETQPQTEETQEAYQGMEKEIIVATDIHYFAEELTDDGEEFYRMVNHGDGKVVPYIREITDAFIEEVIAEKPDALVLSGDLSLNGEKLSHAALAKKLSLVEEAGIPVLVIPGNHDINNPQACGYQGNGTYPAATTSPQEFYEIYKDFGYDEAVSRDPASLSYLYQLDEMTMVLMLDSCQYENGNRVGGVIRSETYDWIDEVLELAWENGANVIPAAHHNLLEESEVYAEDCTIEHSEQLLERLSGWGVNLFLSGHLHVQHIKSESDVYEIVTGSLATPLCRYGLLRYRDDMSFDYEARILDVEEWARRTGSQEEDLKSFDTYRVPFLKRVFYNQARRELDKLELSETKKDRMAEYYSNLKFSYYQGAVVEVRDEMEKDPAFVLWDEEGASGELYELILFMLRDGVMDYNHLHME